MKYELFNKINLKDPFFDSLKQDYAEFENWFNRKAEQGSSAYVSLDDEGKIQGFLYLKEENAALTDVTPNLDNKRRLKIGTFKINPHGTKMGERFIKKILDHAIIGNIKEVYVTIFSKHGALVALLNRYGFKKVAEKVTDNGNEDVLLKNLNSDEKDILLNYPLLTTSDSRKYILSIKPEFHTELFPDSKLYGEAYDLIQDVSHTNSIHKIYICSIAAVRVLRSGDILVMYRTSDGLGSAYYRSVASSICTVEEVLTRASFSTIDEYLNYCEAHSVFDRDSLIAFYNSNKPIYVIKMTYNAALTKRLNRKALIEEVGLDSAIYWGFFELSSEEFNRIIAKGEVNESIIIN